MNIAEPITKWDSTPPYASCTGSDPQFHCHNFPTKNEKVNFIETLIALSWSWSTSALSRPFWAKLRALPMVCYTSPATALQGWGPGVKLKTTQWVCYMTLYGHGYSIFLPTPGIPMGSAEPATGIATVKIHWPWHVRLSLPALGKDGTSQAMKSSRCTIVYSTFCRIQSWEMGIGERRSRIEFLLTTIGIGLVVAESILQGLWRQSGAR